MAEVVVEGVAAVAQVQEVAVQNLMVAGVVVVLPVVDVRSTMRGEATDAEGSLDERSAMTMMLVADVAVVVVEAGVQKCIPTRSLMTIAGLPLVAVVVLAVVANATKNRCMMIAIDAQDGARLSMCHIG